MRTRLLYCGTSHPSLQRATVTGSRLNVARAIANTDCDSPPGYLLTTRASPDVAGSVVASPAGLVYQSGTVIELTAVPAAGYLFSGWRVDGNVAGTVQPLTLTMSADREVEAVFLPQNVLLALSATAGGQATAPAGPSYQVGTEVALSADADEGYLFTGWTVDGLVVGSANPFRLTMDADHTAVATFAPAPPQGTTYALALAATAGGSATVLPAAGRYAAGSRVVLTASADEGYVFTGWTIDGAPGGSANPYTLTMAADRTAVATFAPAWVLTLSATSGGGVAVKAADWAGGSPYPDGTVLTLTATTGSNAVFTGWTIDGVFAGWRTPLTLTMDAPRTIVATFAPRPRFDDLPPGPPPYEAISQLAARRIIHGYADGAFGADDPTLRAQMAALIIRALAWDAEDHGNVFIDRCDPVDPLNCVDDGLWRAVGTLAYYDVARGYGDGNFGARDPVLHIQAIAFITRAMIAKGHWTLQPDDPALYPNILPASGHRGDIATYVHYAGAPPNTVPTAAWPTWDTPAFRGWFAQALWQALDSYFGVDRVR